MKRIVIGFSGATGAIYGQRLLEMLREIGGWETHVVVSPAAVLTIGEELPCAIRDLEAKADVVHNIRNIGASIASGSFLCEGMIVAPCSMRTLAAIANGLSDNLLTRTADVMLKERRRLILMARETPFNLAHLRNMTACTEMGAVVFPPVPAFYSRPETIADLVNHSCMRVLDQFGIHCDSDRRWQGLTKNGTNPDTTPQDSDQKVERQA